MLKPICKLLLVVVLLSSCNTKSQTAASSQSMAKDTPEVNALIEKFKKQEHRLEINDCELIYNGKSFFLGNTLEEIEALINRKYDNNYGYAFGWNLIGLQVLKKKKTSEIDAIYIYMHEGFDDIIQQNSNIILINGVPLTKDMLFGDFLEESQYSFDDFYISKDDFELRPEDCKTKGVVINFGSKPFYNYSGSGHIRIRGDFDPNQTNLINKISIYQSK